MDVFYLEVMESDFCDWYRNCQCLFTHCFQYESWRIFVYDCFFSPFKRDLLGGNCSALYLEILQTSWKWTSFRRYLFCFEEKQKIWWNFYKFFQSNYFSSHYTFLNYYFYHSYRNCWTHAMRSKWFWGRNAQCITSYRSTYVVL